MVESGEKKIQKICDAIRKQTIEPAKKKAEEIIENAKLEAKEIINRAEKSAEKIVEDGKRKVLGEEERMLSSLKLSCRQVIEELRQNIERNFFSRNLWEVVAKESSRPSYIKNLLEVVLEAIRRDGIDGNIMIYLPKKVKKEEVIAGVVSDFLDRLKKSKVIEGDFLGGAKIKMVDKNITLDISDEELTSLVSEYIKEDFRKIIFGI